MIYNDLYNHVFGWKKATIEFEWIWIWMNLRNHAPQVGCLLPTLDPNKGMADLFETSTWMVLVSSVAAWIQSELMKCSVDSCGLKQPNVAWGVLTCSYHEHPTSDMFWSIISGSFWWVPMWLKGSKSFFLWGYVMHWGASPGRFWLLRSTRLRIYRRSFASWPYWCAQYECLS